MECTRVIRAQQLPHRKRPFIIALTANVTSEYKTKCLTSGMDLFSVSRTSRPTSLVSLCAAAVERLAHRYFSLGSFCLCASPLQTKPVNVEELQRGLQHAFAAARENLNGGGTASSLPAANGTSALQH